MEDFDLIKEVKLIEYSLLRTFWLSLQLIIQPLAFHWPAIAITFIALNFELLVERQQ
jgi:hypothetical protein